MVVVKKYGNRRLYDTQASKYVNLDELAAMVRGGAEIQVVDAGTGEDRTREVLLQIVLEVLKGSEFFPTGLLRRMIRASGDDPGQQLLRSQLAAGLTALSSQIDQLEAMFGFGGGFGGKVPPPPPAPPPGPPPEEEGEENGPDGELDELRSRLDALEARLKRR